LGENGRLFKINITALPNYYVDTCPRLGLLMVFSASKLDDIQAGNGRLRMVLGGSDGIGRL